MQKIPRCVRGSRPKWMVQLVGERAALGDLHRIDVADQVGDRDVGRGELLDVAVVAVHPGDLAALALARQRARARRRRDRRERVVVDLAARRSRAATRRAARRAGGSCATSPGRARRGRSGRGRRAARSRPPAPRCRRSRARPRRSASPARSRAQQVLADLLAHAARRVAGARAARRASRATGAGEATWRFLQSRAAAQRAARPVSSWMRRWMISSLPSS